MGKIKKENMKNNPDLHHRRSLRLKGYDYSQAGMYFITLCTRNHQLLFGEIKGETIHLNAAGKMIKKWYWELSNKFPDIQYDEHIVMPNHIHFIIHKIDIDATHKNIGIIFDTTKRANNVGADLCVCPNKNIKNDEQIMEKEKNVVHNTISSIPIIVQWFKTMTTNEYIRHIKHNNLKPFTGKLWQRNYYEHIISNEIELKQIREYIMNNHL